MTQFRRVATLSLMLFGTLLLAACFGPRVHDVRVAALGVTFDIRVYADALPDKHAQKIEAELVRLDEQLRKSDPYDPELRKLLTQADDMTARTEGAYSPRLGAALKLWGFDTPIDVKRQGLTPPTPAALEAALAEKTLGLEGVYRAHAVDRVAALLTEQGYTNFFVTNGAETIAQGQRPSGGSLVPWTVTVRHPRQVHLTLADVKMPETGPRVLSTVGDFQNYFVHEQRRFHHLLDGRTGWPVNTLQLVSVVAPSAAEAHLLAVGYFVSGGTLALKEPVAYVLQNGTLHTAGGMDTLLKANSYPPLPR